VFRNPVGLAAGYDKDASAWRGLAALGFGHLELGTVTPRAQAGNPKPRLFRLPEDEGLINRLGFPGSGAGVFERNLSVPRPPSPVIGINIGKNKDTPNAEAARDYVYLLQRFAPLADYLTVNVSSPNTAGLRDLQGKAALQTLLGELANARKKTSPLSPVSRLPSPILVKLAPDLSDAELDDSLDAILAAGMDGVIAANTTIRRDGLRSPHAGETGGLSGAPLAQRSTEIIAKIHARTGGQLPIIGVGGIMTPEDAKAKLDAGATLVQVYTGMIYGGPGIVKRIVRNL
jgi:dihydroorotate dehydrogenase